MRTVMLVIVTLLGSLCSAQTLLGLRSECGIQPGKKCQGHFQLRNDGLKSLNFSIDSASVEFSKEKQRPIREGLEEGVSVWLSESSGRLSPKETREIDLKVSCEHLPCVVAFANTIMAGHTKEGIAVALGLPHYAYLCDKKDSKNCRLQILKNAGIVPPEQRP